MPWSQQPQSAARRRQSGDEVTQAGEEAYDPAAVVLVEVVSLFNVVGDHTDGHAELIRDSADGGVIGRPNFWGDATNDKHADQFAADSDE